MQTAAAYYSSIVRDPYTHSFPHFSRHYHVLKRDKHILQNKDDSVYYAFRFILSLRLCVFNSGTENFQRTGISEIILIEKCLIQYKEL